MAGSYLFSDGLGIPVVLTNDANAAKFRAIGAIEKEHEERYRKLLENVQNGEVFKKGSIVIWKCRECGNLVIGTQAPQICPVCNHAQAYFEVKAENY